MKKILLPFILLMGILPGLTAQDFIYLRDGGRISAKVQRIEHGKNIIYKEYGKPGSQLFSIKPSRVLMIAYENGTVRFFKKEKAIIQRYRFKKNFFTYHLGDLIINNFTVSYERLVKNGTIGLQIPLSFGYGNWQELGNFKNNFYSGVTVNFYPLGQGTWRYLLGPSLRFGSGNYEYYYYDTETDIYVDGTARNKFYGKLLINNGVMFTPIESLSITTVVSLGIRYFPEEKNHSGESFHTTAAFSFNISYRF